MASRALPLFSRAAAVVLVLVAAGPWMALAHSTNLEARAAKLTWMPGSLWRSSGQFDILQLLMVVFSSLLVVVAILGHGS